MTREEAIKHGKEQLEIFGGEHREFIEMAISALEQEPCRNGWEEMTVPCENCGHDMTFKIAVCGEQEPCEDAVSRQAVLDLFEDYCGVAHNYAQVWEDVENLPSVQPKAKTGRWETSVDRWGEEVTTVNGYRCSECGEFNGFNDNYCPSCGADMRGAE